MSESSQTLLSSLTQPLFYILPDFYIITMTANKQPEPPGCGGGDEPNVNFNIPAAGAVCLLSIRDFYAASV